MSEKLFETIDALTFLKGSLSTSEAMELRGGLKPNFRDRLDTILASRPDGVAVSGTGGNSDIFILNRGREARRSVSQVVVRYLEPRLMENSFRAVAIYPFGIAGLTNENRPIFQDPDTSTMRAVVIEMLRGRSYHMLQQPIEPLFNVDQDGTVLARINDQPTPAELQLLEDITQRFEGLAEPY